MINRMKPARVVPKRLQQTKIAQAQAQVDVQPVNINTQCKLSPDPVRRRRLEGIQWTNNSNGDVDLHFFDISIFCPPPPNNRLPLPPGAPVTLYICDDAPLGDHEYEVEGAHCVRFAVRQGTIKVE
jgi:hypothetical protein